MEKDIFDKVLDKLDTMPDEEFVELINDSVQNPEINFAISESEPQNFVGYGPVNTIEEVHFPRPLVRDEYGKPYKNYHPRDFFFDLELEYHEMKQAMSDWMWSKKDGGENSDEAMENKEVFAEKVADMITTCITLLDVYGYDESARSALFARLNAENTGKWEYD